MKTNTDKNFYIETELLHDILKEKKKQTELLKQIRDALLLVPGVSRAKKDAKISSLPTYLEEDEE